MQNGEHGSTKDYKRNCNREDYYSRIMEEPQEDTREGQGRMQREREAGLGYMPLLRSVGRVLWGSWAITRQIISKQKNELLLSYTGDLF